MKRIFAGVAAVILVPLMSCRTTDSNLQTLDNAARVKGTPLQQNVCHAGMPADGPAREERQKWYDLWFGKVGTQPQIVLGNDQRDVLESELKDTLNAVPMNLLLAYFSAGGRIVVNESSEGVCNSAIAEYTPEKVVFAREDSAPLEAQTTNAQGQIQKPGQGPQTKLPEIRSCWVANKTGPGVAIHINDNVEQDSERSLREDGLIASSVRHGTVRIFGFILSELIAHTYIEPNNRKLDASDEESKNTFKTELDRKPNQVAGFEPSAKEITFGDIKDPKTGKTVKGLQIPVNNEFMKMLDGLFDKLNQDVLASEGRYTLDHYLMWMDKTTGKALPKFRNVLNHFAFADAFDTQYCNKETREKFNDFNNVRSVFASIATGLEEIQVAEPNQQGMITTDRGYLLAANGSWHGDLYYGVYGENLGSAATTSVDRAPKVAWFFRAVFGWFGRAVARVVRFVYRTVVRPIAITAMYVGQGILYTAGAAVGTVASVFAPNWTAYQASVGRGVGPFSKGFVDAGRFWTWNGHYYAGL